MAAFRRGSETVIFLFGVVLVTTATVILANWALARAGAPTTGQALGVSQ